MGPNDEYVLGEAGCLDRGCEVQIHDVVGSRSVELVHVDKTGARSAVTFGVFMFRMVQNPYTGQRLQPWVPEFVCWVHEIHRVGDKMAEALPGR